VPIPNADHLLDQAERLAAPLRSGAPRQADLRRAISSAYYSLFHFCLSAVADEFVGVSQRTSSRYALVYRSVDHRGLKDLCAEARKQTPPAKYVPYFPLGGFDLDIQVFSTAMIELQERRHQADYNPQPRFSTADAQLAIATPSPASSQPARTIARHF
jgi:hypothetical protein